MGNANQTAVARTSDAIRRGWQRRRHEARLRKQLRGDLSTLAVHSPISMEDVCRHLSQRRTKPILILPYPLEVPGPEGLWLSTPSAEYVLYQAETTFLHQQHIIAHEVGHIISDHCSDESDDGVWAELMPDIPPEVVRRALRRSGYDSEQEWTAEAIATMLLKAASVAELVHQPAQSARARRAQQALGDTQEWL